MSVYSIAKDEADRHARANAQGPQRPRAVDGGGVGPPAPPQPAVAPAGPTAEIGKALDSIGTYVPTEIMATYLGLLAIIPATSQHRYLWLIFWLFLVVTPVVVWIGVSAAHPGRGLSLPLVAFKSWPWLSMIAATLAFAVFAISLPGSVVNDLSWFEPWMGSAAILVSAFVLSQVKRFAG